MRSRRLLAALLTGTLAAMMAVGCSDVQQLSGTETPETGENETVTLDINDFAFRFSEMLNGSNDSNFLCSPFSAWLPLAALVNVTDSQSQPELLKALGVPDMDVAALNESVVDLMSAVSCEQKNEWREEEGLEPLVPLQLANAVFVDKGQKLASDFAGIMENDYDGTVMNVDFASPDAVRTVNDWASEHTDGFIKDVIQQFDPQTQAAIANAIYFSDRWSWEFNEDETAPATFHAPNGDVIALFMRREGMDQLYFEDDKMQAIRLDFIGEGGMLVLLPKDESATSLLTNLSSNRFDEILSGFQNCEGTLKLPRFEIGSDCMELNEALEKLGVPIFDVENPALTGVLADGNPLFISQAVQSARIRVDEQGTTAAAVTVMAMTGAALPDDDQQKFEMNCDHPFAFVLYGDGPEGTHPVLFTGVVADPS